MKVRRFVFDTVIRILLKLIARVRAPRLSRVPEKGPLIIAVNHINFLEVPLLYTLLRPRRTIGMAKIETWNNPVLRVLANLWEAIPIRRSYADTRAFKRAAEELERGAIIVVAPEGTRSGSGRLQRANAGIVTLAARTGVPILPIAHFGGERVWSSLRRGRRTIVTVRVGEPIHVVTNGNRSLSRAARDSHLAEVMHSLARLLPERYRGYYRDAVSAPPYGLSIQSDW